MGTASSSKCYCGEDFKQEEPLKGSLIEGAKSKQGLFTQFRQGQGNSSRNITGKIWDHESGSCLKSKGEPGMHGEKVGIILDSGSMVSLVQQSYFDQNIKPKLSPARGQEANLHNLFDLKGANGGDIPITKYFEMDVAFLGLKVPKFGFLVVKDPSDLVQTKKKTKLPGIIGWNLIKLAYQEFIKKYPVEVFNSFQCPQNVDPLLFSQLCVYFYTDIWPAVVNEIIKGDCVYTESIATNLDGDVFRRPAIYHLDVVPGWHMHLCCQCQWNVGPNRNGV